MRNPLAWIAGLRGRRAGLAAAGLGALSALALPPVHVVPLLLLAIPGLLVLIGTAPRARSAFARGFWFGLGHHVVGLYWITEAILIEAARFWWFVPIAVPALSAVLALFIAGPCALAWRARSGWRRLAVLSGAWVLADLARQFILTGFPWNPLGSVWALPDLLGDAMIQPAAVVGVPGLTLMTLLVAGTPALGRRALGFALMALAAWGGAGLLRLQAPHPPGPGLVVALVQGNIAQGQKWDRAAAMAHFQRYLTLTRDAVALAGTKPVVVIWPETASPYPLENDRMAREMAAKALGGGTGLLGTVTWDATGRPRNSLVVLRAEGIILADYDKTHLVPFGEYDPGWLPLPVQVVPGRGFGMGSGPTTLTAPGIPPVGPMICYEAAFPGQVVGTPRPAWLVNVTNDAWFGNSTGPRQHLAAARMRAVEEGLPLARAANTGISAMFDGYGHEVRRLGMNETGLVVSALPGALPPTPFSRGGLAIPGGMALVVLLAGLWRGWRVSRT